MVDKNSKLKTQNSKLIDENSKLKTQSSKLIDKNSKLKAQNSKLKAQNSKLISKKSNSKFLKSRTYRFSLQILRFISDFRNDRILRIIGDQLLRSGTSIGANITEAIAASSRKDFTNYFQIALKSANETRYWLSLLKDSQLCKQRQEIDSLLNEVNEIAKMIASSVITLKNSKLKAQNSKLINKNSKLKTKSSKLINKSSKLKTKSSKLISEKSKLKTKNSKLKSKRWSFEL